MMKTTVEIPECKTLNVIRRDGKEGMAPKIHHEIQIFIVEGCEVKILGASTVD